MKARILWTGVLLGSVGLALAQDNKPAAPVPGQPGRGEAKPSAEEQAIRAAEAAFVEEFNKGDARALGARFTEEAELVTSDGSRIRGRDQIGERLAQTFAASPGGKLQITAESIEFLSPDVAKEEGRTVVTLAGDTVETLRHTALLVKRGGRWLISSCREDSDPLLTPHERLKELEWMVGDWVDEGQDSRVKVSCRWSEDGNFLLRRFEVQVAGKSALTIHQRVAWDPLAKQFRSWEFDSEGGYGEGKWSRDGEQWMIKHTGVRPEGITASATHIVARERPDLVRWVSTDRVVGDEFNHEDEEAFMVRVPPSPRLSAPAPGQSLPAPAPAPAPAPNQNRSPQ